MEGVLIMRLSKGRMKLNEGREISRKIGSMMRRSLEIVQEVHSQILLFSFQGAPEIALRKKSSQFHILE